MNEKLKSLLDEGIGCYILSFIYGIAEYDLLDVFDVVKNSHLLPATYICSRECYIWS